MKILKIVVSVIILLSLNACTNKSDATRALEAQGFTNIQITGYNMFDCSQDDLYHTGFKATNINGIEVEGTVCSGLLKNATIRY